MCGEPCSCGRPTRRTSSPCWTTRCRRLPRPFRRLRLLQDSIPSPQARIRPAVLAILRNYVSEFDCTQLANTEDGRIVAYDPTDATVRVYDSTGQQLQADVEIDGGISPLERAWFVDVGPTTSRYLTESTAASVDSQVDLLAIPLVGERAGEVVVVWTGLDGSGDTALVPRRCRSHGCRVLRRATPTTRPRRTDLPVGRSQRRRDRVHRTLVRAHTRRGGQQLDPNRRRSDVHPSSRCRPSSSTHATSRPRSPPTTAARSPPISCRHRRAV